MFNKGQRKGAGLVCFSSRPLHMLGGGLVWNAQHLSLSLFRSLALSLPRSNPVWKTSSRAASDPIASHAWFPSVMTSPPSPLSFAYLQAEPSRFGACVARSASKEQWVTAMLASQAAPKWARAARERESMISCFGHWTNPDSLLCSKRRLALGGGGGRSPVGDLGLCDGLSVVVVVAKKQYPNCRLPSALLLWLMYLCHSVLTKANEDRGKKRVYLY